MSAHVFNFIAFSERIAWGCMSKFFFNFSLRDKLEVDRYQSLVLYFLMSIFRYKTFFKDNEIAIKIYNYNIHKQYQKEEKLASQMFYYWEVIEPIPVLKPSDIWAFASASSLLVHH